MRIPKTGKKITTNHEKIRVVLKIYNISIIKDKTRRQFFYFPSTSVQKEAYKSVLHSVEFSFICSATLATNFSESSLKVLNTL